MFLFIVDIILYINTDINTFKALNVNLYKIINTKVFLLELTI